MIAMMMMIDRIVTIEGIDLLKYTCVIDVSFQPASTEKGRIIPKSH